MESFPSQWLSLRHSEACLQPHMMFDNAYKEQYVPTQTSGSPGNEARSAVDLKEFNLRYVIRPREELDITDVKVVCTVHQETILGGQIEGHR